MAVDYAQMEREFLAGLEVDTGHDLAQWMALIDSQRLAHRNDIIDWLRQQGFAFSWASWLERIHHNGGRPIYGTPAAEALIAAAGGAGRATFSKPEAGAVQPSAAPAMPASRLPERPALAQAPAPALSHAHAPASPELAALLAKAKAYRMLAEHLIREVRRALPDVTVSARDGYVSLARPAEFAAIAVGPRELRLGLDLGEEPEGVPLPRGRMAGPVAGISHVVTLTDARQVTPGLIAAVCRAAQRVNGE